MYQWIGREVNPSGSYHVTECPELSKRLGYGIQLYKFYSRFGECYYISDCDVILEIEDFLSSYDSKSKELYEYLYNLVVEKFGMIEFLTKVGLRLSKERSEGYVEGQIQIQKELRKSLGL